MSPVKTSKCSWGGRGRGFKSRRSDQLSIFKSYLNTAWIALFLYASKLAYPLQKACKRVVNLL